MLVFGSVFHGKYPAGFFSWLIWDQEILAGISVQTRWMTEAQQHVFGEPGGSFGPVLVTPGFDR